MKMKSCIGLFGVLLLAGFALSCSQSLSFPTGVNGVAIVQSGGGNIFPPPPITHQPLVGAIIVIQRTNGQEVARQAADDKGGFQIDLAPGAYLLNAQAPPDQGPFLAPAQQNIVITSDRLTQVVVTFSVVSHF